MHRQTGTRGGYALLKQGTPTHTHMLQLRGGSRQQRLHMALQPAPVGALTRQEAKKHTPNQHAHCQHHTGMLAPSLARRLHDECRASSRAGAAVCAALLMWIRSTNISRQNPVMSRHVAQTTDGHRCRAYTASRIETHQHSFLPEGTKIESALLYQRPEPDSDSGHTVSCELSLAVNVCADVYTAHCRSRPMCVVPTRGTCSCSVHVVKTAHTPVHQTHMHTCGSAATHNRFCCCVYVP